MQILPHSINQSSQLHNRKNDVNFGMKLSPEYGVYLVDSMLHRVPSTSDSLDWRYFCNRSLDNIKRFVLVCEKHEKQNPGKWILKDIHYKKTPPINTYTPDILGATPQETADLSVEDILCVDENEAFLKFTENLEKLSGVTPKIRSEITDENYQSKAADLAKRIASLIQRPNQ